MATKSSTPPPDPPEEVEGQSAAEEPQTPEPLAGRQIGPLAAIPEERPAPEDWTPPGDWKKGFYPGDPNIYPDPDKPKRTP